MMLHRLFPRHRPLSRTTCRRSMSTDATPKTTPMADGEIIKEGRAKIIFPKGNQVFYNKVQVLNRDLSIAVINQFAHERAREAILKQRKREKNEEVPSDDEVKAHVLANAETSGLKIFEALSASGLRSIRYWQEIAGVKSILVNDLDPAAVISIKRNIEFNGLTTDKLIPNEDDATSVMYRHRKEADNFDVIDLDPYGSASIFLDGAVQAIANGGLLCVTCTDMPVLSGKDPDVCFHRYGSVPYKSNYLHENALRMVLHSIESAAIRYQKHIVPVVSCSIDFYVRVFVRVYKSPVNVKASMTKQSYVYQCAGCDSFHMQPLGKFNGKTYSASFVEPERALCDQCGKKFKMSGPIWSNPLHDRDMVLKVRENVIKEGVAKYPTKDRLHGLLTSVSEEVVDAPLYYTLHGICKTLHCSQLRMDQMQSAILNAGYKVSQSHKVPEAIKTDAPNDIIWDIMRCWVKKHPISKKHESERDAGTQILAKEPKHEAVFTGKRPSAGKEKALRFPKNPEAYWGPKSRARGLAGAELARVVEGEPEGKKPKLDDQ